MHPVFELLIKGEFKPGFKRFIKQLADENDIKGHVKLAHKKEIEILLQGDKSKIQTLLSIILDKNSKAIIHHHHLNIIDFEDKLPSFKIIQAQEKSSVPFWKKWMSW